MSIHITHKRLYGGYTHECITDVRWTGDESHDTAESTKQAIVTWIDEGGVAYVGYGGGQVRVGTAHPNGASAYLRTYADEEWNNNLLELPDF